MLNLSDYVFLFTNTSSQQFKHVPLYLEWAPLGVFSGKPEDKHKEMETAEKSKGDKVLFTVL